MSAWRYWALLSFSIRIAQTWANSIQYCLTSNFEWLEWRRFSFLSFNLLFQFCKWDRYWLWRSSCRRWWSFFLELRCPAAACHDFEKTLSYIQLCCSDKHLKRLLKTITQLKAALITQEIRDRELYLKVRNKKWLKRTQHFLTQLFFTFIRFLKIICTHLHKMKVCLER